MCVSVLWGKVFFKKSSILGHIPNEWSALGQAGCVSREWKKDEQNPDISVMCVKKPKEMETHFQVDSP